MVMWILAVNVVTRVLLLPLGAPVLKPDLDLRLCQTERQSQTQALADGQVTSQTELALERRQLIVAECCSSPAAASPAFAVVAAVAAAVVARICRRLPIITFTANAFIITGGVIYWVGTKTTDNTAVILVSGVTGVVVGLQPLAIVICAL